MKLLFILVAISLVLVGCFLVQSSNSHSTQLEPIDSVNPSKVIGWSNPISENGSQINWKQIKNGNDKALE